MANNETLRRLQVSLTFNKRPKGGRDARLEILDDVSGQALAVVDLDPAQFIKLMGSDVLLIQGHTSRVAALALSAAQDC